MQPKKAKLKKNYTGTSHEVVWVPIPKPLFEQFDEENGIRNKPRSKRYNTIGLRITQPKFKGQKHSTNSFHFIELDHDFSEEELAKRTVTKVFVDVPKMLNAKKIKLLTTFLTIVEKLTKSLNVS